ncbi:MAG: hypothetical protein AAFW69_10585 [Pseudomonadota bacterium]
MTEYRHPTPEEIARIEARARELRAKALQDGLRAAARWLRELPAHLAGGRAGA